MSESKLVFNSTCNRYDLLQAIPTNTTWDYEIDMPTPSIKWVVKFSWSIREFEQFANSIESATEEQDQYQSIMDDTSNPDYHRLCGLCGRYQDINWAIGGMLNERIVCQPCASGKEYKQLQAESIRPKPAKLTLKDYIQSRRDLAYAKFMEQVWASQTSTAEHWPSEPNN